MRVLVIGVLVMGCYHPAPQSGAPCGANEACPSGLTCRGGYCLDSSESDAPPAIDGATDTVVAPDGCTTFSTQFDTCLLPPGAPLALAGVEFAYNTDSGKLDELNANGNIINTSLPTHAVVQGGAGLIDVLVVSSFSLGVNTELTVTGSRPFALAASESVTIAGRIDASGGAAGARSAGTCGAAGGKTGTAAATGGAGGGGGALGSAGAGGGSGVAAGAGASSSVALPAGPIGGCGGGRGGTGSMANSGGYGGAAGGAVYLVSKVSITVAPGGIVEASGNGGGGGEGVAGAGYQAGGGGGGSGGMLWFEALQLEIHGLVVANGGSGGEGSGTTAAGMSGQRGKQSATPAGGGAGGDAAGADGGAGAAASIPAMSGGNVAASPAGGGGGGGGVGFIVLRGSRNLSSSVISPAPL